jgi:uncharacterized BrkB/YihY/UPF0761 family membrane protein
MTGSATPPQPEDGGAGQVGGRLDAARAKAREVQARLAAARGEHASVDTSFQLIERDQRLAASVLAGGIAYRLFFWLLPLALLLFGALGFTSSESAEDIAGDAGLAGPAADALGDSVGDASRGRWVLLVIGLSGLIWAGSRSVLALRRVYSLIWNVPPVRGGNPFKEAFAFSGVCLLLLSIAPLAHELREISSGPGLAVALLAVGAYFGIWLWVSTRLPHADAPLRALIPGAVVVAVTTQLMQLFTAFYLADRLERSSALYGGLGLVATFLFFLYIIGRVVVASAMLNAELWTRRAGSESNGGSPG